jgi:methionyl-tRNA formyltransferase
MRIVFLGSGTFGLPTLHALTAEGQEVVLLVTQPDRPAGRGQAVVMGPVKRFGRDQNVPVFQPEDVNAPPSIRRIKRAEPELLLAIAYGQKLGSRLLETPEHGAINLHGSLLPKYRGAAPINWAVINGETETGLSVIEMIDRMDAGDILGQRASAIGPNETAGELQERLAELGARLVAEVIREVSLEEVGRRKQNETQVTFAPRLKKSDGQVPWDRPALQVYNHVRGMTPWPGAFTHLQTKRGKPPLRLVLSRTVLAEMLGGKDEPGYAPAKPGEVLAARPEGIDVATARGTIRILELTPAGKRTMSAADFIHGYPIEPGTRFLDASKSPVS